VVNPDSLVERHVVMTAEHQVSVATINCREKLIMGAPSEEAVAIVAPGCGVNSEGPGPIREYFANLQRELLEPLIPMSGA
jgi:hypothetical protein